MASLSVSSKMLYFSKYEKKRSIEHQPNKMPIPSIRLHQSNCSVSSNLCSINIFQIDPRIVKMFPNRRLMNQRLNMGQSSPTVSVREECLTKKRLTRKAFIRVLRRERRQRKLVTAHIRMMRESKRPYWLRGLGVTKR